MSDRKTDGGKGDRIPGANQSAYEAGYAGIQWGDGVDGTDKLRESFSAMAKANMTLDTLLEDFGDEQ